MSETTPVQRHLFQRKARIKGLRDPRGLGIVGNHSAVGACRCVEMRTLDRKEVSVWVGLKRRLLRLSAKGRDLDEA